MSAVRRVFVALAVLCAHHAACAADPSALSPQPSAPAAETLDYGLFGTLHLRRPPTATTRTVMLVSDSDGWTARQDGLADALATEGAFVVGIDLPAYLKRMESIADHCSFPAAHFEEVAHWIERHEDLATYSYPLVVGDGAGATFAYAMTAQAPAGTFEGLLTLGWDPALRFAKPFCPGDAGGMTIATDKGRFRVAPLPKFPLPWTAQPFAAGARSGEFGARLVQAWRMLGAVWPSRAAGKDAAADLAHTYAAWRQRDAAGATALPDDVADLPLTEIAPTTDGGDVHRIAIIITGDGGWAGLDRGIADALTAHGMHVVGFSTLKFFWQKQTPDATAQAIARVIAHFGKDDPAAAFVLIGYSFGASLVPVVINRLPEVLRRRVQGGVMISPDDEAVFEIHVGDWFGATHHDEAMPLGPEIAASKVALVCVHGADEDDSFCLKPQPPLVRVVALPGGHHYDGDYDKLGTLIVQSLPGSLPEQQAK